MRSTPESGKSNKFLLPPTRSLSLSIHPNPTAEKAPVMDLEVVGRHALLFDDDPMAAFVNSPAALVDWHSLSIDRYDVRHLLSAPPPPRKARRPPPPSAAAADSSMEAELDRERYLDLPPPPTADEQEQHAETGTETANDGGYRAVAFSYGNPDDAMDQKTTDADSGYCPPFPVPEYLLQNLMLGARLEFI